MITVGLYHIADKRTAIPHIVLSNSPLENIALRLDRNIGKPNIIGIIQSQGFH